MVKSLIRIFIGLFSPAKNLLRGNAKAVPDDMEQARNRILEAGGRVPLDFEEQYLLSKLELEPDSDELAKRLERVRFNLGKLPRDRTNELILDHWRSRNFVPGNMYIQITNECNLRCVMCAHRTAKKDGTFMDEELFELTLDRIVEAGIDNVYFASAFGEALLHPKALDYISRAIKRGRHTFVVTNGNFLDADFIEKLVSVGLDHIQFSFFGYDKPSYEKTYVGGDFERASENLRLLKAALKRHGNRTKLAVHGVNITNDPLSTRKVRNFLLSLGLDDAEIGIKAPGNFGGRLNAGSFSQKIGWKSNKPVDEMPLYVCPQLLTSPGIMADGRFTACGCLDNNGSLVLGDIRQSSIAEIRDSTGFKAMIDAFLQNDLSAYPLCAKCDTPYGNINGSSNTIPAAEPDEKTSLSNNR